MKSLLALLLTTTTCQAADITVYYEPIQPVVFVDGDIVAKDIIEFESATRDLNKAIVRLRSRGGKIDTAIEIGHIIHDKKFTTDVYFSCQSACALMWMAGVERTLPPGAVVGFHQPRLDDGSVSIEGVAWIGAYLDSLGYSKSTILFAVSAKPNEMRWIMNASEAEDVGIAVNNTLSTKLLPRSKPIQWPVTNNIINSDRRKVEWKGK